MRLSIILFLVFISVADCFCQNRNSVWCFGDSAGIDFSNLTNPVPIVTYQNGRGSCVSIADTSGNLLFYAYTRDGFVGNTTIVRNKNNQIMLNGDSIIGQGWYEELCIVPMPGDSNQYYLFSIGVTTSCPQGVFYSVIDMSLDSGLGAVTIKNTQLLNYAGDDCIKAIKHGNGRDWWVVSRHWNNSNDEFYEFLVTPSGISPVNVIHAGPSIYAGLQHFEFSKSGQKIVAVGPHLELFDFDRCSGIIQYDQLILTPMNYYATFSPNEQYLYASRYGDTSYVIQYDLNASNIELSADTLWTCSQTINAAGCIRLAPDSKIYMTCASAWLTWPYSVYDTINNTLSLINYPDSLGAACDFQPLSFNLGFGRTYWGLPNNPDYDMPRLQGSPCDTIQWTGVQNIEQAKGLMYVTYISGWQKLFVNAQGLKGRSFKMSVYDLVGNVIYTAEGKLSGQYFTRDLKMAAFANGMYIVNFVTDKERLAKKFIKD